jgi:putative ABC transport system permease protein
MLQSFKLAIKSIWGNKMRSFLTMLGIIIGVAAVIILVSLVNGYMADVMKSYSDMGANQIQVNVTNLSTREVDSTDVYHFYDENPQLFEYVSPSVSIAGKVRNGTTSLKYTAVQGCSEQYIFIRGIKLQKGRSIMYSDLISRQNVCVIGAYVAQKLYGSAENAVGQKLKIGDNTYDIVGAMEAKDENFVYSGGEDDFVLIPYTVAVKVAQNANIGDYVFTVKEVSRANEAVTVIEDFLRTNLKDKELYRVTTMSGMLDSLNKQMSSISNMLGGIAGISLLVAGVGVMNIMLVSVTERTREIGIRKSLGANKGAIMQQFIIEAAVTSSLGGMIGILVGCSATSLVGKAVGLVATPSLNAVMVSFGVSVGIGLFFGFMPANRAASLNPIDALRND